MTDIVERLRAVEGDDREGTHYYRNPDGPDGAAEIERLRALIVKKDEALGELYAVRHYTQGKRKRDACGAAAKALALTPADMQGHVVVPVALLREARELMDEHVPGEHGGDLVMAAIDDVIAKRPT